ncbi:MAG: Fe-S-binding domain-containing protein, partial [Nitrospinaceae bacterium]
SIGLPGMNGFVGEFMILLGFFQVDGIITAIATSGVIFAACYILWMFQRVMFQELKNPENMKLSDINTRELITVVPLIVLIFWIGLYPKPFMKTFDASVSHLITKVDPENFRPSKPKHSEHAALIGTEKLAKLQKELQGK